MTIAQLILDKYIGKMCKVSATEIKVDNIGHPMHDVPYIKYDTVTLGHEKLETEWIYQEKKEWQNAHYYRKVNFADKIVKISRKRNIWIFEILSGYNIEVYEHTNIEIVE